MYSLKRRSRRHLIDAPREEHTLIPSKDDGPPLTGGASFYSLLNSQQIQMITNENSKKRQAKTQRNTKS